MKRARATELVEQMLKRLDSDRSWPLKLVQQVWVFGSYSRGALEPKDVDLAVRFERDDEMKQHVLQTLFSGRGNPYAPLRAALAGTSRGLQFSYEDQERQQLEAEGVVMLPLWQRGDTLKQALAVLHGIAEDPHAGRAERDDMIDAFTGLDRYIPRQIRADLVSWQDQGYITISQVQLPDAPQETELSPGVDAQRLLGRWSKSSPLRRAAIAGVAYMQTLGADPDHVDLAGEPLPTQRRRAGHRVDPTWWVNWKWQGYRAIPSCVTSGRAWLEVVQPTATRPLNALLIQPGANAEAFRG